MKKLFTAIRQGNLDEVKSILEKKFELVNCVSGALPKKDHGQSPLQVALKTGKYEIADYLISHGADVNFMEEEDDDPGLRAPVLFDAINATITSLCYRRIDESDIAFDYVKLLIEKGADVNKLASNGYDSINWSINTAELLFERSSIYPDVQEKVREQLARILDLLIENGADYVAWANRGHYPEPYPGPSNKSMYIDDFIPGDETDIDKNSNMRLFMQNYFKSRNLKL
ncbi:ankyrin repeat domain-containing protein [Gallibacter sp. Marseille-QA0791]|uniref:ankyrin repeat domain-containing protein n=1 Tax=Gallibacter sp. Marseille-QA0791 TaxID=3378781 RepID=UPI003D11D1CE